MVTVTPEVSRISVLSSGRPHAGIVWNLGAGLYYMLVDKGTTKRTVNALTRRIAVSVVMILLVALAIYMGWITPHGVGG